MMKKHNCPVCGEYVFESLNSYDICSICGWEDDQYQEENPDEMQCANQMSLNQAKEAWSLGIKVDDLDAYEKAALLSY